MTSEESFPKFLTKNNDIKEEFLKIISSKTDIWIYNSDWNFEENFPELYLEWMKKIDNKQTVLEIKDPKFKDSNENFSQSHKLRFLQTQFGPPQTIVLFEDKVLLIIGKEDPSAILIENKETSNRYKEYFTILWEAAKTKTDLFTKTSNYTKFKFKKRVV
jgi:hypothetical protein